MNRDRRAGARAGAGAARVLLAVLAGLASACATTPQPIDRQPIPGTRVSLSVPAGFHVSDRFAGIASDDGTTSVIVNETEKPAVETMDEMTEREFANRGMRWLGSEKLEIDERSALLVHALEPVVDGPDVRRSVAVLGDAKHSVVIAASTTRPAAEDEVGVMRDALVTATWDPDRVIDPFLGLGFRVKETSLLRLSDRLPALISFTVGGNRGKLGPEDPLLLAWSAPAENRVTDIEAFGRYQLIQTAEFEVSEILASRTLRLDGLPAHEVEASATDRATGMPLRVHQTLVLGPDRYFVLQGMVGRKYADEVMPHFRAISASFERSP